MKSLNPTATVSLSANGILWIKLAVLYLIVGVAMGIGMGISHDFTLRPVHAHVNLLGWATMALAGLIYSLYPHAGSSRLGKLHFWLANLSLPVMSIALTLLMLGNTAVVPVLGIAEIAAALGVLVFAANIFINIRHQ